MGCDDLFAQRSEFGRVVRPCRIYGPTIPPEVFDRRRQADSGADLSSGSPLSDEGYVGPESRGGRGVAPSVPATHQTINEGE